MKNITATLIGLLFLISIQTKGQTPTITYTVSPVPVCACSPVNISCSTTNSPSTVMWYFPGGNPSFFTTTTPPFNPPSITYCTPGLYDISAVASNANGSDSETVAPAVIVEPLPVVTITPPSGGICDVNGGKAYDTVYFEATYSSAYTYSWVPTAGLSCSNCPNPHAYPSTPTVYTLTVTDAAGCTTVVRDTVTAGYIVASIWGMDTICPGQHDTLLASGGSSNPPGSAYVWSNGSTSSGIVVSPSTTTTYTCTIFSGTGNCESTAVFTVSTDCATGVENISTPLSGIEIMPNPVTSQLSVLFTKPLSGLSNLTIIDITGREVYTQSLKPNQQRGEIDVSSFARGMYFIELKTENSVTVKKFIKD